MGGNFGPLEPVLEIYPPLVLFGTYLAAIGAYLVATEDLSDFLGLWALMTFVLPVVLVWQVTTMDMTREIVLGYSLSDSTVAIPLLLLLLVAYILMQSLYERFQEVA